MIIFNTYNNLPKTMHGDLDEHYKSADQTMLFLMFIHWFLASFVFSIAYNTYFLGITVSTLILIINIYTFKNFRGKSIYRTVAAISLLSFSILFIQQQFGRIELHFHIFIALSFLMIYKDLKPVIVAALFIIVHHVLFFILQNNDLSIFNEQIIIFNYGCGWNIVLMHAFFVLFELSVLVYILNKQIIQFLAFIKTKYEINEINANLESTILKRTEELVDAKDKAEESARIKEEFLANMSHEIRTPMNAVLGFTDLLYEDITDSKHRGFLKSIRSSGRQLLQIINDILEISKVQAGKMDIHLTPVNPYALLKDLHSIFKVKIDEKNIKFIFDIDNELPKSLLLDEVRVRQVLFNILGNAVKFTETGFIKVTATKIYRDEDKSILDFIIKVKDTGIGVNLKEQDGIFDPFIQQKEQSTNKFGGTGLGLSISKKLTTLMGGDITLESIVGEGSIFTIQIDNISVSSAVAEETDIFEYEKLKSYKFEHAKILLVDDIETNRVLIKNYLAYYDFEITEADNGADAVRLSTKGFDLILMDIKMPIMDGYEATNIIKSNIETKNIPIFALTASVLVNETAKVKNEIFDSFLCKPIDKKSLIEEIATVLPCKMNEEKLTISNELSENSDEEIKIELTPEAIEFINNELIPKLNDCKDSGDMDKISDFSTLLQEFLEEHSISSLDQKVEKLNAYIEAFDIEHIFLILEDINLKLKSL